MGHAVLAEDLGDDLLRRSIAVLAVGLGEPEHPQRVVQLEPMAVRAILLVEQRCAGQPQGPAAVFEPSDLEDDLLA